MKNHQLQASFLLKYFIFVAIVPARVYAARFIFGIARHDTCNVSEQDYNQRLDACD